MKWGREFSCSSSETKRGGRVGCVQADRLGTSVALFHPVKTPPSLPVPQRRARTRALLLLSALITLLSAASLHSASFIVPTDREMIVTADSIIEGVVLSRWAALDPQGEIVTHNLIGIDTVLKGSTAASSVDLVEPGGILGNEAKFVSGVPVYEVGERVLVFVKRDEAGRQGGLRTG